MIHVVSKKLIPGFLLVFAILLTASYGTAAQPGNAEQGLKAVELKPGNDLESVGQQASNKHVPVLLMFSQHFCRYCVEVEEDFLKPMLRNPEYDNKVIMRKVSLDGEKLVQGFNGELLSPDEFSDKYNISMTPTIILVDADGKPMAKPIIGLSNPFYYGAELDQAIDSSLARLRNMASN